MCISSGVGRAAQHRIESCVDQYESLRYRPGSGRDGAALLGDVEVACLEVEYLCEVWGDSRFKQRSGDRGYDKRLRL